MCTLPNKRHHRKLVPYSDSQLKVFFSRLFFIFLSLSAAVIPYEDPTLSKMVQVLKEGYNMEYSSVESILSLGLQQRTFLLQLIFGILFPRAFSNCQANKEYLH